MKNIGLTAAKTRHASAMVAHALCSAACSAEIIVRCWLQAFEVAIMLAGRVFDAGASLGFNMWMLDLGGGVSSELHATKSDVIGMSGVPAVVNAALAKYFPENGNYQIIAEPGRSAQL
jgi:diaminopimelate decarboxylase